MKKEKDYVDSMLVALLVKKTTLNIGNERESHHLYITISPSEILNFFSKIVLEKQLNSEIAALLA